MNILQRGSIWSRVLVDYFASFAPIAIKILNSEETVAYAAEKRISLIRFGDGEFNILNGKDVHYQVFDQCLQAEMKQIVQSYDADSPYLLCMPHRYFSKNNLVLNKRVLVSCWSTPKRMFKTMCNPNAIYGDAFVFAKNNRGFYGRIWKDYTSIVMLHHDKKYFAQAYDDSYQKGYFIQVPVRDSYSRIDALEQDILQVFQANGLAKNSTAVLMSAGPAAKVLAYRLSQRGYIVIDCGHLWDDPLEV